MQIVAINKKITFRIVTVGCRLNKAETAQIEALLLKAGYELAQKNASADIVIIHSCAVTGKAEEDSIRLARVAKEHNKNCFVVIAGCLSELYLKNNNQLPADLVLGQSEKFKIDEHLKKSGFLTQEKIVSESHQLLPHFSTKRAIIKVQDGCSFNCAYCVVPKTRGAPRSRSLEEIVSEAKALAANFPEIVLTGANLGSYEDAGRNLLSLLDALIKLPEIKRIRLSSIEISTVEKDVIELMASSQKICRYLHLPMQSGSNKILKAMGRRYTIEEYLAVIKYATKKLFPIGIGTDVIAGFPGETEEDFLLTCKALNEAPFSNIHAFSFSIRQGTYAASMTEQLPQTVIKTRTKKLLEIAEIKKEEFARKLLGLSIQVVIEKLLKKENAGIGWSGEYVLTKVYGNNLKEKQLVSIIAQDYKDGMIIAEIKS